MSDDCAMWCTDCGTRLRQEEIVGWGCPKCGRQGVPCAPDKDVTVEVNWHELHILCCWAEFWAQHAARKPDADDSAVKMPKTVYAIARRLQGQWPALGALTLAAEVRELPELLADKGVTITTNVAAPPPFLTIGEGAVGHGRKKVPTNAL